MLLENLLNELKVTLKNIRIKELPIEDWDNDVNMYKFFKNKTGVYKKYDRYYFKVKNKTKSTKYKFGKYGFTIINLSVSDGVLATSKGADYNVSFDILQGSGFGNINLGNPMLVMRGVANVLNHVVKKKPKAVFRFYGFEEKRNKLYLNLLTNMGVHSYVDDGDDIYFSKDAEKIEGIRQRRE